MLLNISTAKKNPGLKIDFEYFIKADNNLLSNEYAKFKGDINFDGCYYYNLGNVYIEGEIKVCIDYPCDRCLKSVIYNLDIDFDEVFYRESPNEEDYLYEGEFINLEKPLNDYIILNQPMSMICSEKCKGLCTICGTDLNIKKCNCSRDIKIDADNKAQENPFAGILKYKK